MNKLLVLQGGLYTVLGALPPVAAVLASNAELTARSIICLIISGIIGGATALKAFLSTNFAESKESKPDAASPAPVWQQPLQ